MGEYWLAIKRPFSNVLALTVAVAFLAVPFLNLILTVFVLGYVLQTAKTAMFKDYQMPHWKDWGKLFAEGLGVLFIGIIYLIPFILILLGLLMLVPTSSAQDLISQVTQQGWIVISVMLLAMAYLYIVPVPLLEFAVLGRVGSAFAFGRIFHKLAVAAYFKSWSISLIYALLLSIILTLVVIPFEPMVVLPIVLASIANAVWLITSFTLFGEIYPLLQK